jgi:single-stranded DNA-binding protein
VNGVIAKWDIGDCEVVKSVGEFGLLKRLRANVRVGDGEAAQWISVLAFDERALASADKYLKGARVYCEGRLTLGEYTAGDGSKRASLSVMSWHFRLPQIGRNKPKRKSSREQTNNQGTPAQAGSELDDQIPF